MEILLFLNNEDLRRLKEQFDKSDDPGFTILEETVVDKDADIVWVNVFFSNSIILWYTIGSVFQLAAHEARMKEIMSQLESTTKNHGL